MSGRHGRGVPDDRHPQAAMDMEVSATVTVIAGLLWRLRRQDVLSHPKVQAALRELHEQVEEYLASSDHAPGRHRSKANTSATGQINDVSGLSQKPDPLTATTSAEFVQTLWKYKYWSGDPSWRAMARAANHRVVHSTMHSAMNSEALPKFEVMRAIILGCGGGEEDLRAFATAWRRIDSLNPHRLSSPEIEAAQGDGQSGGVAP
jgi:hypothetical protein